MNILTLIVSCSLIVASLQGCATVPPAAGTKGKIMPPPGVQGIYHTVKKGETLWRISKMYGIDLTDLASINKISDTTAIEIDQQVFIPNRKSATPVCIAPAGEEDFIWPVKGTTVAGFGQYYRNMVNKGIYIKPGQSTSIVASRSGRVVFYSPDFSRYGKTIVIDHGDGISTVYATQGQVMVKPGDLVKQGMVIATAGSAADGDSCVLFQVRKGFLAQNPNFYLSS